MLVSRVGRGLVLLARLGPQYLAAAWLARARSSSQSLKVKMNGVAEISSTIDPAVRCTSPPPELPALRYLLPVHNSLGYAASPYAAALAPPPRPP